MTNTSAPRIAAIILAAGKSTRMGAQNKLLLDVNGKPLLQHVIDAAATSHVNEIMLVTGHERERIEHVVHSSGGRLLHNADYAEGMASSIRTGIQAAQHSKVDAALILLGDMPYITASHINHILTYYQSHASLCVPYTNNQRGNPVLWGKDYFADLLTLTGDQGARDLIKRSHRHITHVKMDALANAAAILKDIDHLN